ncbi:unnamed protein product [Parajaminaea phylloscopi]
MVRSPQVSDPEFYPAPAHQHPLCPDVPEDAADAEAMSPGRHSLDTASPDTISPFLSPREDIFLTPRAGSPSPGSGSEYPFHTVAEPGQRMAGEASLTEMARTLSASSSQRIPSQGTESVAPAGSPHRPPQFLTSIQTKSAATLSEVDEASPSAEQGSLLTITPSRPSSSQSRQHSALMPEDVSASREDSQAAVSTLPQSPSPAAAHQHGPSVPAVQGRLDGNGVLVTGLEENLIAEGLTEAAAAVSQELNDLETVLRQGGSPRSDAPDPTDLTSIAMSDRQMSVSSEISRTPSTSTSGSLTAQSSTSAETAPSSVLSDGELTPDIADGRPEKGFTSVASTQPVPSATQGLPETRLRRYLALLELFETEQSYARDLATLSDVYMDLLPLQQYFEDHPTRVDMVVRNTPELVKLHKKVAADIGQILSSNQVAPEDAGTIADKAMSQGSDAAVVQTGLYFQSLGPQLLIYSEFCARHSEASAIVREAEKRHNGEDFAAYERLCRNVLQSRPSLSRCSSIADLSQRQSRSGTSTPASYLASNTCVTPGGSSGSQSVQATPLLAPLTPVIPETTMLEAAATSTQTSTRLTLADLLIKPIQRLCLYPLILQTIIKHASPEDAAHREMEAAVLALEAAAQEVNRIGKDREQFLLAELVASRIEPLGAITRSLLSSLGNIRLSGTLDVLYHHTRLAPLVAPLRFRFLGLFLYQHELFVVKVRKSGGYAPNYWFPLLGARLSSVEEEEGVLPHAFRLTIDEEHHFELAASSSRERALWVEHLSDAIEMATLAHESASTNGQMALLDPANRRKYPSCWPARSPGISAPRVTKDDLPDPLHGFLSYQSNNANSAEVLVRYASIPQRATVDKGMVFSEAVLSARAITQKDGSFTPGGSITKSSSVASGSTTPTAMSVAGLTAWPATTHTSTSSLGLAVGAAMGLARAAKRSSNRQSASSNVFELAAQQFLAAEEQRAAPSTRYDAYQLHLAEGGDLPYVRTRHDSTLKPSVTSTGSIAHKKSSSTTQWSKRPALASHSEAWPISTTKFSDVSPKIAQTPPAEDGVISLPVCRSPSASSRNGQDEVGIASYPSPTDHVASSTFESSNQNVANRRSIFLNGSGSALREALPATWSRRGRSKSAGLDMGLAVPGLSLSPPTSPRRHAFFPQHGDRLSPSANGPSASYEQTLSSGDKSIRGALTDLSEGGEGSQSVCESPMESPACEATHARAGFESSDRVSVGAKQRTPNGQPRRRTSSSFGNSLGLIGQPMDTLRRSMSFSRWGPTRSNKTSPTVSTHGDLPEPANRVLPMSEASASQPLLTLSGHRSHSPGPISSVSLEGNKALSRSATDSKAIDSGGAPTFASRPSSSRSSTSPLIRFGQLSADLFSKARTPSGRHSISSPPSSRAQSRRSSACSINDGGAVPVPIASVSAAPTRDPVTYSTSPEALPLRSSQAPRTGSMRRSRRLSALFSTNTGGQLAWSPESHTGSANHSRSNSSEAGDVTTSRPLSAFLSSGSHRLSFGGGGGALAARAGIDTRGIHALPSPLAEENENPMSPLIGAMPLEPRGSSTTGSQAEPFKQ